MTATKPLPPHGTYARANGRFYADIPPCGCPPCRDAEYRYDKQRRIDIAAGHDRVADAGQAATDVEHLAAAGMTYVDIARAARCAKATITNLRQPGARVTAQVAARIAAVRAEHSDAKPVPALGAGHSQAVFAAAARLSVQYVSELANERIATVRADTHSRVAEAYETLLALPVPTGKAADRARRRARLRGWPPPEQWDGEIDNPDADPAMWTRHDTACRSVDLVEDAEFIIRTTGIDLDLVVDRLGVSRNRLDKARERVRAQARAAERQALAA